MAYQFDLTHAPVYGQAERLFEGLRCVTAPNASPMTFTGTRSYILGQGEVAIIDPGPALPEHIDALIGALSPGERITHIFLTHSHLDHSAAVPALKALTGAGVYAFGHSGAGRSPLMERLIENGALLGGGEGIDADFVPDHRIADGAEIIANEWWLRAHHTPGHMSNHLCFHWPEQDALFTGDHIMGWASTLVSPPDGDLTAFMRSLDRIEPLTEKATLYPGHGAPVADGTALLRHIREHRQHREAQILTALQERPAPVKDLTALLYSDTPVALHPAAARNVFAHLLDLLGRGLVQPEGALGPDAVFYLASRI